ncbi:MAG: UbiX family flavin prenyltransferase [candidate division NC10 bacterium]|jgi:4-hydroxy-3-polyprenylbenzoate decarboxylase|nr:UbiX family flavin prenyltransferase [candidate division NC10 bacterium]MCH7896194.1 UbiX family flavin prenyltransferase [candidate division NC10 bacterium]MCZ6550819.1 UbiX family flavin prenyltransferase [candidate division NC10 bacterium]
MGAEGRELILAITGASGVAIGVRLVEVLVERGEAVHLVISSGAETVIRQETGRAIGDLKALATFYHSPHDLAAPLASGSYVSPNVRAMVVAPCSMKTVAAIASGFAENLIGRAADVILKEGKRLVLVPRESPLNVIHLENLLRLARVGVAIVPPTPPFYQRPSTVPELLDQIVGRILDQVGIHTDLTRRWSGHP